MRFLLAGLLALGLAALTYLGFERLGRRGLLPMLLRAVAWGALFLLLFNVSCPAGREMRRPLVLLDASLSMGAAGGRWSEARDSARRLGEVRTFGDERPGAAAGDSVPDRGRTLLAPTLTAASASDRPVIVVTDGEIEDAADIPPDLLGRAGVRLFPRAPRVDLAVTRASGPARLTAGDTLAVEAEVRVLGDTTVDSVTVMLAPAGATDGKTLARRTAPVRGGLARVRLEARPGSLAAGQQLLRVALAGVRDAEPRTDERLLLVTVAATPGIVLLADPADWDSRFLFRTLRDVAQLPVRGYVRVEPDRWRSMTDLSAVSSEQVRQAARRADLLILKGGAGRFAEGAGARGLWLWPSGETGPAPIEGDWYLAAPTASPVAGAFLGAPFDSFPPAFRLVPLPPEAGEWVGLSAQQDRRGAERPAVVGAVRGRTRRVTVAVDGLWRWAFRGGSSEEAYRTWVAATTSWLLGGADTTEGRARPVRPVAQSGRPVLFEWVAGGRPEPLPIRWTSAGRSVTDTLRFDAAGRAELWLPVGEHRYRLLAGPPAEGIVAVEAYSDELLPHAVALAAKPPRPVSAERRTAARDWLWLFGLAVVALSAEWLTRRRLGLR